MAYCKTAVTPLLMHWSHCSLALNHQFEIIFMVEDTEIFILGNYFMVADDLTYCYAIDLVLPEYSVFNYPSRQNT